MLGDIKGSIINPICLNITLKYYSVIYFCWVMAAKKKWESCAECLLLQMFAEASLISFGAEVDKYL